MGKLRYLAKNVKKKDVPLCKLCFCCEMQMSRKPSTLPDLISSSPPTSTTLLLLLLLLLYSSIYSPHVVLSLALRHQHTLLLSRNELQEANCVIQSLFQSSLLLHVCVQKGAIYLFLSTCYVQVWPIKREAASPFLLRKSVSPLNPMEVLWCLQCENMEMQSKWLTRQFPSRRPTSVIPIDSTEKRSAQCRLFSISGQHLTDQSTHSALSQSYDPHIAFTFSCRRIRLRSPWGGKAKCTQTAGSFRPRRHFVLTPIQLIYSRAVINTV